MKSIIRRYDSKSLINQNLAALQELESYSPTFFDSGSGSESNKQHGYRNIS